MFFSIEILLLLFESFKGFFDFVGVLLDLIVFFSHVNENVVDLFLLIIKVCGLAEVSLLTVLNDFGRVILPDIKRDLLDAFKEGFIEGEFLSFVDDGAGKGFEKG